MQWRTTLEKEERPAHPNHHTPVFCSKPFGILEPMKDVRAECAVIVVMFWKDDLDSNRESWLKESQAWRQADNMARKLDDPGES